MFRKYWDDPVYRFLLKAVFLYLVWYLLYQEWLHPMGSLDLTVIRNLEFLAGVVLESSGFQLIAQSELSEVRTIGIDGTHGLWIGDPCNGLTLFALFIGFVLAYPGPWKKKLWFIPMGMVTIHLLNVLRIVGLALTVHYFPNNPEVLDFNHTYTFTMLVYGYVFFLWYIWASKFSGASFKKSKSEPEQG